MSFLRGFARSWKTSFYENKNHQIENALFRIESCAERRKNVKRGALSPCDQFESTTSDCIGLVAQ
jgi:hypothetical protein